jgi:ParB family transcriptional regulator, chromosome partitioning protein
MFGSRSRSGVPVSRKNVFSRLTPSAPILEASAPAESEVEAVTSVPAQRVAAVGALGRMLHTVQRDAQRLEEMQRGFLDGDHVVDLDPEVVDPSPIRDRIDDETSDEQARLNASIAESGQRIPILVRPNPNSPDRFVVVFGHRRLAAASANGCKVRAIVADISEADALVAQGQENNERKNTSFIERCLFARRLRDAKLTNLQIASALAVHPSLSSVMMGIAEGIPEDLILAIGPAPNIGRPRWQALISSLQSGSSRDGWRNVASEPGFAALPSTTRFQRILDGLSIKAVHSAEPRLLKDEHGAFASVRRSRKGELNVVIPAGKVERSDGLSFADWMDKRLQSLREEYLSGD